MWLQTVEQTIDICMALSGDMGHKHQYGPHQGAGKAQATLLSASTMPSSTMFSHVVNQEENIEHKNI